MVLLTGATGFIGSHLLAALQKLKGNNNVVALTSAPITNGLFLLHNQYQFTQQLFNNEEIGAIDTVVHAGAFTPKNSTESNSIALSNSNIFNTQQLLFHLPPTVKQVVFLSTLDIYENTNSIINESTAIHPVSLYGYSKLYCEKIVEAWGKANNVAVKILRIGHVYGPGEEKYQKLIPASFAKLLKGQSLQIWGSGGELRSFIYIDDVVNLIIQSIESAKAHTPVNIVSNHAVSIKQLVQLILKVTGFNLPIEYVKYANSNARDLVFSNELMHCVLGKEQVTLEEGLTKEWNYFKQLP